MYVALTCINYNKHFHCAKEGIAYFKTIQVLYFSCVVGCIAHLFTFSVCMASSFVIIAVTLSPNILHKLYYYPCWHSRPTG